MPSNVFVIDQSDLTVAIDQQKLVRSVLQRIADLTGERIYSSELSSEHKFVEPQEGSLNSSMLKHRSPISE